MHVTFHIEAVAMGHYVARFTVRPKAKSDLPSTLLQLERVFPDRRTAVFTALLGSAGPGRCRRHITVALQDRNCA